MEHSDKSRARTQSSESSVQLTSTDKTLTTLVLDVLERLTILEQSFKYSDLARSEIVKKVDKLAEICAAKAEVEEMSRLLAEHEDFFKEFRMGLRVAKAGWAFIYISGGTIVGAIVQW
ncbi:MAG TPA: hypothetical protein VM260_18215, partial [Pirellula sp.]|nr:hypothetical protein [Pirellula sp.]